MRKVATLLLMAALLGVVVLFCGCASQQASPQNQVTDNGNATANAAASAVTNAEQAQDDQGSRDVPEDQKPTLKVGYVAGNSPFTFVTSSGQVVGLDADLAYLTGSDQGWRIEMIPIAWGEKDALLESGAIDCIWSSFTQEWRTDLYALSTPYYVGSQVILVKKGSPIDSKAALRDKTVAVQNNSMALAALQSHSGGQASLDSYLASMRVVDDVLTAVNQLKEGTIDAIACSNEVAQCLMCQSPNTYQVGLTLYSEHYAVAFKKGEDEKAKLVSESLARINRRGDMEELCQKYAAYGTTYGSSAL